MNAMIVAGETGDITHWWSTKMTTATGGQEFENFDAFVQKVTEVFPDAQIEVDNEGQYVIYTNLTDDPDTPRIVSIEDDWIP